MNICDYELQISPFVGLYELICGNNTYYYSVNINTLKINQICAEKSLTRTNKIYI